MQEAVRVFPKNAKEVEGMEWSLVRTMIETVASEEFSFPLTDFIESLPINGDPNVMENATTLFNLGKALYFDVMAAGMTLSKRLLVIELPETVKGDVLKAVSFMGTLCGMIDYKEEICSLPTYLTNAPENVDYIFIAHELLMNSWEILKEYV